MVLSYAKIALNNQLIHSDVPEDPYLGRELDRYFPDRLSQALRVAARRASPQARDHHHGDHQQHREPHGADLRRPHAAGHRRGRATVSRAYTIAREVFDIRDVWQSVERLDNKVAAGVQYAMVQDTIALIRQVTYWLIQRHRGDLGIESQVGRLRRACAHWRLRSPAARGPRAARPATRAPAS